MLVYIVYQQVEMFNCSVYLPMKLTRPNNNNIPMLFSPFLNEINE